MNFKGQKVHSAAWDHDFDYSNKRIAVIGNGSSGIQILPKMAKLPGTQITSFQRGPTWVVNTFSPASLLGKDDPAYNPEYTEEEKKEFREDEVKHNAYRKKLIHNINDGFKMVSMLSRRCKKKLLGSFIYASLSRIRNGMKKFLGLPNDRWPRS